MSRSAQKFLAGVLTLIAVHPVRFGECFASPLEQTPGMLNPPASFEARRDFEIDGRPVWIAVGDFNGDGHKDLATANEDTNSATILLGDGNGNLRPSAVYPAGRRPQAVAVGDFDGDSIEDLVVVNSGSNSVSILLGNGEGTFRPAGEFAVGNNPSSVAIADFNGDRIPDLAVTNANNACCFLPGSVSILLGVGDGTFRERQDYVTGLAPISVAVADFDQDDRVDLAVANSGFQADSVSILLGNGDGSFQAARNVLAGRTPRGVVAGDFNEDGRPDLAVAALDSGLSILIGTGQGEFLPPRLYQTGVLPRALAIGDFNGDGHQDLAIVNSSDPSNTASVFLGSGDGTFTLAEEAVVGRGPYSVLTADFNEDGHLDIATGNGTSPGFFGGVSILLGLGDGQVIRAPVYPAELNPKSIAIGDFNRDSHLDVAVSNETSQTISILLGNGDGSFQATRSFPAGYGPRSLSLGDFDEDSNTDLVVANYGNAVVRTTTISLLFGNGDGTFRTQALEVGPDPSSVAVGDFNGDGHQDLAVTLATTRSLVIFLGSGDGTFRAGGSNPVGGSPFSVKVGDFNGDGREDLAVANAASNDVSILLGNGDGSFGSARSFPLGTIRPEFLTVGDVNGDLVQDLVVTSIVSGHVSILLGNGDGTFGGPRHLRVSSRPESAVIGDFDGDGWPDLVIANGDLHNVAFVPGKGDGTFGPAGYFGASIWPSSVSAGDFDENGRLDVAVANHTGASGVSILLNRPSGLRVSPRF